MYACMSTKLNIKRDARLFLYVVVFISAVALVFLYSFRAEAEIVLFNALSIEHQVTSADTEQEEKEYEYVWSAFTGVVPEGASVEHITFTLSWIQSTTTEVSTNSEEGLMSEGVEATTETGEPTEVIPVDIVDSEEEPTVLEDIQETTTSNTEEIDNLVEFPQIEPEEDVPPPTVLEEPQPVPTESTDIEPDMSDRGAVTGFPLARKSETYLFAQEDVQEDAVTVTEEVSTDINLETEEAVPPLLDSSEFIAPAQTPETSVPEAIVIPVLEEDTLSNDTNEGDEDTMYEVLTEISNPTEVVSLGSSYTEEVGVGENVMETDTAESANFAYSFDGIEWFPLGTVNLLTLNEISFDMSQISLEVIPSLRIRVRYHASSIIPEILFEKPQLALSYTPGVIEEPVLIVGDQEPNFLVSSVYADVMDGTTRAVLLERGGIFELWVYAIERATGLPLWTRLMSSGVASQELPISVKERTVFWFDSQIQALYVFGIDEKSLKIFQPQSPQDSLITVPVTKANKNWTATFDTISHTFTFTRTPNTSL